MKKGEQKYVLQLTPLEHRRHKRQGQRHRFEIGDVRSWKQKQRAWTLNINAAQKQGKDSIERDWNGQNKSWKKNFSNWSNSNSNGANLKLYRSVTSEFLKWTQILKGKDFTVCLLSTEKLGVRQFQHVSFRFSKWWHKTGIQTAAPEVVSLLLPTHIDKLCMWLLMPGWMWFWSSFSPVYSFKLMNFAE